MNTLVLIGLALLFFALIMASIALHEIGHLVPAKLFGVKVTQYFVGFGRTIWSRKRGETEYGFKMFPLGGYVRLVGMYPPEKQTDKPKGWLTRMADQARSYEYEEISPSDDGRLFHQKPVWQKVIIMLGGPAMNVLLAFLIFLGINFFHGTWQSTLEVTVVNDCVIPAGRVPATCQDGDPQTPAKQAGMQVGDKVVAFNGHAISNWNELTDLIRANRDGAAAITVERRSLNCPPSTRSSSRCRTSSTRVRGWRRVFLGSRPAGSWSVAVSSRPRGRCGTPPRCRWWHWPLSHPGSGTSAWDS